MQRVRFPRLALATIAMAGGIWSASAQIINTPIARPAGSAARSVILTYDYGKARGATFRRVTGEGCAWEMKTPENPVETGVQINLDCGFSPVARTYIFELFGDAVTNRGWVIDRLDQIAPQPSVPFAPPGSRPARLSFPVAPVPGTANPRTRARIEVQPYTFWTVIIQVKMRTRVLVGAKPADQPLFRCDGRPYDPLLASTSGSTTFSCASDGDCLPGFVCNVPACGPRCVRPNAGPD